MAEEPKRILGWVLAEAMIAAGVIRRDESVTRLVIDMRPREPVRIFVERVGDERLLSVVSSLEGVQIVGAPADSETTS